MSENTHQQTRKEQLPLDLILDIPANGLEYTKMFSSLKKPQQEEKREESK